MVVNFRARRISRGARKVAQTPTLINFFFGIIDHLKVLSGCGYNVP